MIIFIKEEIFAALPRWARDAINENDHLSGLYTGYIYKEIREWLTSQQSRSPSQITKSECIEFASRVATSFMLRLPRTTSASATSRDADELPEF